MPKLTVQDLSGVHRALLANKPGFRLWHELHIDEWGGYRHGFSVENARAGVVIWSGQSMTEAINQYNAV